MPRPPGPHNQRDSRTLAVRVPNTLAEAIYKAAGGEAGFPSWARRVFEAAAHAELAGPTSLNENIRVGWEEGRRAGWAKANQVFREALKDATAALDKARP